MRPSRQGTTWRHKETHVVSFPSYLGARNAALLLGRGPQTCNRPFFRVTSSVENAQFVGKSHFENFQTLLHYP
jgi:hypothetical protein